MFFKWFIGLRRFLRQKRVFPVALAEIKIIVPPQGLPVGVIEMRRIERTFAEIKLTQHICAFTGDKDETVGEYMRYTSASGSTVIPWQIIITRKPAFWEMMALFDETCGFLHFRGRIVIFIGFHATETNRIQIPTLHKPDTITHHATSVLEM